MFNNDRFKFELPFHSFYYFFFSFLYCKTQPSRSLNLPIQILIETIQHITSCSLSTMCTTLTNCSNAHTHTHTRTPFILFHTDYCLSHSTLHFNSSAENDFRICQCCTKGKCLPHLGSLLSFAFPHHYSINPFRCCVLKR